MQKSSITFILFLFLPVILRYFKVSLSTGKKPHVAPYSGAIFEIVDLSESERFSIPSPKNSTNLPTAFIFLSFSVIVKTKSVAVNPSFNFPLNLTPITSGNFSEIGCPSITASASIPPTPQPKIERAFTIVVWLSVPTTESKYNKLFFSATISDIYSILI